MKIAVDIDSTLHHYWDVLSDAARRRFGIELPYEEQFDWGLTRLKPRQLELCIEETHTDEVILAGRPYPDAVDVVRGWKEAGHYIQITSHRARTAHGATERWLHEIGLPFDELYCSYDKVGRCLQTGIDVLVDDSPINIARALEHGMVVATIEHPWNRDVCEEEDILCAPDWLGLQAELAPVLVVTSPQR